MIYDHNVSEREDIQELNEIIAIEILLDTYKIDVVRLGKQEIKYLIKLLGLSLQSTKVREE